jgi:hypothetical protein
VDKTRICPTICVPSRSGCASIAGGAVALSGLDNHPNVNGGAADKQYKPPPGCKKHPHKKKCVRPPIAHTDSAHHVTKHSATLTGRVVVYNHLGTKYYFVWGVCPHLNHRAGFGSTSSSKNVSVTISGLEPGTKYCYALVATNSRGTSHGATRSFATQGSHKSSGPGKGNNGNGKGKKGKKGHKSHHGTRQPSHSPRKKKGFTG